MARLGLEHAAYFMATVMLIFVVSQLASYRLDPRDPTVLQTTRVYMDPSLNGTVTEVSTSVLDDPVQTTNTTTLDTVLPDGSTFSFANTTYYVGDVISANASTTRYDRMVVAFLIICIIFAVLLIVFIVFLVFAICRSRR